MATTIGAVLEVFTWVGIGAGVILAGIAVAMWAADGTWLSTEAYVDHEGGRTTVRWIDVDGDVNSAPATGAAADALAGLDRAWIWYRHGWQGRMRLTRRAPELQRIGWATVAVLAVGIVAFVGSWVLLFLEG